MDSFDDSSRDVVSDSDNSFIAVKKSGFRSNRIVSDEDSETSDVIENSSEEESQWPLGFTPRKPDSSRNILPHSDNSLIAVNTSGSRSNRILSDESECESSIIKNSNKEEIQWSQNFTPRKPAIQVPTNIDHQHTSQPVNNPKETEDLDTMQNRRLLMQTVNVENPDKIEHQSDRNQIDTDSDYDDAVEVHENDNDNNFLEISDDSTPINESDSIEIVTNTSDGACALETLVEKRWVSPTEYNNQQSKIDDIKSKISKNKFTLRAVNPDTLPDKGANLKKLHDNLEQELISEVKKLSLMEVKPETTGNPSTTVTVKNNLQWNKPMISTNPMGLSEKTQAPLSWDELKKGVANVQPATFGKRAIATFNAQKAITVDRLHQLHGSLETCPAETDLAEDPKGLKVELMEHQKRALLWLMWREKQKPSGGILADDMGLGKTLTMISLVMKVKEEKENSSGESHGEDEEEDMASRSRKVKGGTLVVCPASLIEQWSLEIKRKTKRGILSVEMFHGAKRETSAKRLAAYDFVLTTYSIVNIEARKSDVSLMYRIRWARIILDEAHNIRNHKTSTSDAVFRLLGRSRWSLTGTPVHNRELDLYAQLKFLRCRPFDDYQIWKRWVSSEGLKGQSQGGGGRERLHTVISSLMLRRTKEELLEKATSGAGKFLELLNNGREMEVIEIELNKEEYRIYEKVLILSRTLFAQFLHQRAEKNQDLLGEGGEPNQEYFKMRQMLLRQHRVRDIKQHEILVLLLRLRQICCHPSLIKQAFNDNPDFDQNEYGIENSTEEFDLLEQLNKLNLNNAPEDEDGPNTDEQETINVGINKMLSSNHPIFSQETASSKITSMLNVLKTRIPQSDKIIIVSQWSGFLKIIGHHLKKQSIVFEQLDGTVPVPKRMDLVDRFNNPRSNVKVLLLSLTAGGVGLNLTGGNHLFLVDLHWNPQLEKQAQDRIYRVGQSKRVHVYKFFISNSIEKRILDLQEKKLNIAESTLTGTKQLSGNKLTLQDLKTLFEM